MRTLHTYFRNGLAVVLGLILLGGCEQLFYDDVPAPNDRLAIFDALWQTVDERYSFFDFKNIDWQEVRSRYRPRAAQVATNLELFDLLGDMLGELRDGHVNLIASFDLSRNWDWFLDAPPNFNATLIERNYLGRNYRISGPLQHTWLDSVGYVYYESFGRTISAAQLDFVLRTYANARGLILDVRDNGGGSLSNATRLAERFADQEQLISFRLYKTGPGHQDFSTPVPRRLGPGGDVRYEGPVAVLTNRKCYSATNDFVLLMQAFPQVTVVGDTTGGGGGLPTSAELPNGWRYRFSSTVTLAPDGFNVEDGIPPDVRVDLLPADEARGVDTILETALNLFR